MKCRLTIRIMCLVLLLALLPLPAMAASDGGMMRVWLSSIRANTTYNLTLTGAYQLAGQTLASGTQVKVEFTGGQVYVTAGTGTRVNMGTSATLARQNGGIRIREGLSPSNVYPGDFAFFYSSGTAYVVCTLYIEDYLYGVLPYEMDATFPLEALKSQAVAARTYALFSRRTGGSYDVTDTTSHQVFRGVPTAKSRCTEAVDATRGQVMLYGGAYIEASFGASNGGQTETRYNAWGSSQVAYQAVQEDTFDAANASSVKKSYLIHYNQQSSSPAAYAMLSSVLAQQLGGVAAAYTVEAVTGVTAHTPLHAAPSRLYTKLRVNLRYNGGRTATVDIPIFPTVKSSLGIGINSTNNELITVTEESTGFRVTARRYGHGIGLSQRGAQQRANQGQDHRTILAFYYPNAQLTAVTLTSQWAGNSPGPVDPGASTSPNPSTEEGTPARVVLQNPSARLNLRGTPRLDGAILANIPNGASVRLLNTEGTWCKIAYGSLTGYVAAEYLLVENVTPPDNGDTKQQTAYVTLASGTLNLRKEARATADIVGRLPNGAKVDVLDKGAVWTQVRYAGITGYVMSIYLTGHSTETETPPAATADVAIVTLQNIYETVNLRQYPSTGSPILARIPHGKALQIYDRGSAWTQVAYLGQRGYVMNSYLRFENSTNPTPTPSPTPAAGETWRARVVTSGGTLNLREQPNSFAPIMLRIPAGATVTVTRKGETWCGVTYAGEAGFVMRSYLSIDAQPIATATPDRLATIRTQNGGAANLRRTVDGDLLATVPYGAQVTVLDRGSVWSKVRYGTVEGYVATDFLVDSGYATPAPTVTPTPAPVRLARVVTKNGGGVNLRRTANGDVIGTLPYGAEVTLLDKGSYWSRVRYGVLEGYVATDYLMDIGYATAAPTATPTPSPSPTPNRLATVRTGNGGNANMRNTAGGDIIASLPYGTEVVLLQRGTVWSQIRYGTLEGYVSSDLLMDAGYTTAAPTATPTPTPSPAPERLAILRSSNGGGINMRNTAGGDIIATLPYNTQVVLLERGSVWSRIRYERAEGYVSTDFVVDAGYATAAPTATPTATPTGSKTPTEAWAVTANNGRVNVRKSPVSGDIIGNIPHGARVEVLDMNNAAWPRIRYGTLEGYASAAYLAFSQGSGTSATTAPTSSTGSTALKNGDTAWVRTSSGSGVNLRKSPDGEGITSLPYGTEVTVLEAGATWSRIRTGQREGYVASAYLSTTKPSTSLTGSGSSSTSGDEAYAWVWAPDKISIPIRSTAKITATAFDKIPHGTKLIVLESEGEDWAFVEYREKQLFGYVQTEYLDDIAP